MNKAPRLFALGLSAASLLTLAASVHAAMANRTVPDRVALEVDGIRVGALKKVDLVDTSAATGASGTSTDATLTFMPTAVGKKLTDWVAQTTAGQGTPHGAAILTYDANLALQGRETFPSVSIAEVDLPGLQATSKDPVFFRVKLSPVTTTHTPGDGSQMAPSQAALVKNLVSSNFRLQIDGVDCAHTVEVGPLVVTAMTPAPAPRDVAQPRLAVAAHPLVLLKTGSGPTVSNLVVTVATGSSAAAGYQQFQQWLSGGHAPKGGSISYLSSDMQSAVCTTTLGGLVITKITTVTSSSDAAPRAQIEMRVASAHFSCP